MRTPIALGAAAVAALCFSCAADSDPTDPTDDVDVTIQAQNRAPFECVFNGPFDLPGALCSPQMPRDPLFVTFKLVSSSIPAANRLYNWDDIFGLTENGQLVSFQRVSGCGPASDFCTLRVSRMLSVRQRIDVTLVVNDATDPGALQPFTAQTFTATATIPPSGLMACNFNGVSIPHGQSVTAFLTGTAPVCEYCESQVRTCDNGVLSGYATYGKCTPRRLRPGQQCP